MDRRPAIAPAAPAAQNAAAAAGDLQQQQTGQQISFDSIKVSIDQADQLASRESWRDSFKKLMTSIVQETPISTLRACSQILCLRLR